MTFHTEKTKQRLRECRLGKPQFTRIGENIPCEICGKEFYVMPYLEKQKQTCSKNCWKIWKSIQAKKLGYGKWMKGRTNHISKEGIKKLKIIGKKSVGYLKKYIEENGAWNKGIPHTEEHKKNLRKARAKQITPIKDTSIEVKIQNFLKQLGIEFFTHQYMKIEHCYQCDILIPSMNLVIECDGDYWHKYPIGLEKDHIRTRELLDKGFKVLRLWEFEIKAMNVNEFKKVINHWRLKK